MSLTWIGNDEEGRPIMIGKPDSEPPVRVQPVVSPPVWYTPEEIRHYLRRSNYAPEIAEELATDYAANLQKAFEKGFEMGRRANDAHKPSGDNPR